MEPETPTTLRRSLDRARWRLPKGTSGRRVRVGAIVALATAAGLVAWVLVDRSDESPPAETTPAGAPNLPAMPAETVSRPTIQSVAELRETAATSAIPVYWAGARTGMRLELSQTTGGTTFVRYLPSGTRAGDLRPRLTVATYARPNGFAEMRAASKNEGTRSLELEDGALAVYDPDLGTNVHFAHPGKAYQVEVYSPAKGLALRLLADGRIRPVL